MSTAVNNQDAGKDNDNVKVAVRCRPFNEREKKLKSQFVVDVDATSNQVVLKKPDETNHTKSFRFDYVYDDKSAQKEVYEDTAYPLVESVLEGYNGTIFAYGQTGCGKTWTMQGPNNDESLQGIIPNSFQHIFDKVNSDSNATTKYLIRAGYIEIYNEEIRDLLGNDPLKKLSLREDPEKGVYVQDLTMTTVKNVNDTQLLMDTGQKSRVVGRTNMNAVSSRSHAIFVLNVETSTTVKVEYDAKNKKQAPKAREETKIKAGKLNLVDLAGSERQSKTGAQGMRLKEATKINLSLSALGNVISALVEGKGKHIPYRDSKLTRLLQDSLGGNTKTVMIACISPAADNYDETLSTLRYANRAKNIKNKPKINEDPKDALLKQYQDEIRKLKQMLSSNTNVVTITKEVVVEKEVKSSSNSKTKDQALSKKYAQLKQQLEQTQKDKELQDNMLEEKEEEREREQHDMMEQIYLLESQLLEGGHASNKARKRLDDMKSKRKQRRLAANERERERGKDKGDKKWKMKYKEAQNEIEDLMTEFENQRADLLQDIRTTYREMCLYRSIVHKLMSPNMIDEVMYQSQWNAATESWSLPAFMDQYQPQHGMGIAVNAVSRGEQRRNYSAPRRTYQQKTHDNMPLAMKQQLNGIDWQNQDEEADEERERELAKQQDIEYFDLSEMLMNNDESMNKQQIHDASIPVKQINVDDSFLQQISSIQEDSVFHADRNDLNKERMVTENGKLNGMEDVFMKSLSNINDMENRDEFAHGLRGAEEEEETGELAEAHMMDIAHLMIEDKPSLPESQQLSSPEFVSPDKRMLDPEYDDVLTKMMSGNVDDSESPSKQNLFQQYQQQSKQDQNVQGSGSAIDVTQLHKLLKGKK